MGKVGNPPWTEFRIAELTRMTNDGLSAAAIGKNLECSRNAVIGRWNRMNFDVKLTRKIGCVCKPVVPRSAVRRKTEREQPVLETYVPKKTPVFSSDTVDINDLHFFHCKAVVGARKYCGQPVHRRSFCAGHFKLYYQPPKKAVEQTKVFA